MAPPTASSDNEAKCVNRSSQLTSVGVILMV
jgi:hypothetical protein